jgi:hemoglobin
VGVERLELLERLEPIESPAMNSPINNTANNTALRRETLFDQLGGEPVIRRIVGDFMERVFADRMIGFFFRNADKERIKELEYQLAAAFLGAAVKYTGRPLGPAHAKHPIMGGHFARRKQILKEILDFHRVPEPIKAAWLDHTEKLRSLITAQAGSDCDPVAARRNIEGT